MDSPHTPGIDSRSAAGPSLPQRIWGVFTAPRAVFEFLDTTPRFQGAFMVFLLVAVVMALVTVSIGVQTKMAAQNMPDMSDAQRAVAATFALVILSLMFVLLLIALLFATAGVLLLVTNRILGGATTYKRMIAAQAHIWLIFIPRTILAVPLILYNHDANLHLSLAAFLPSSDMTTYLYQALDQFDVFNLWMVVLTVLSVSILGSMSMRKAAVGVVATWAVAAAAFMPLAVFMAARAAG